LRTTLLKKMTWVALLATSATVFDNVTAVDGLICRGIGFIAKVSFCETSKPFMLLKYAGWRISTIRVSQESNCETKSGEKKDNSTVMVKLSIEETVQLKRMFSKL